MLTQLGRRSARLVKSTSLFTYAENGVSTRAFSSQPPLLSNLQVGDRILLRWRAGKQTKHKLTKPLRQDGETILDNHILAHKDILGKPSNTRITTSSKDGTRKLHVTARHPSLDEFTALSPRRVAPIYATYCSTITSLLDVHAEPYDPEGSDGTTPNEPTLQILEAGTGHGSLTLHLSRLIAPSNPPIPQSIKPPPSKNRIYRAGEEADDEIFPSPSAEPAALQNWRHSRRAILHTIDIDPLNRRHADQLIRSYRNAVYWPHIDFHVSDVKLWIPQKLIDNAGNPFLDVAVLDMPGVESYIAATLPALKDGGLLCVFAPQITQIATCVQEIVTRGFGLKLERVVELGDGVSTGRLWDVRMAMLKNSRSRVSKRVKGGAAEGDAAGVAEADGGESVEAPEPLAGTIPPMVCRPIVGELTRGGGFIGLWKKVSAWEDGPISS